MSINYELLRKLYPEWEPETNPLLYLGLVFLLIMIFLLIPYIYIKFVEFRIITFLHKIRWKIAFRGS